MQPSEVPSTWTRHFGGDFTQSAIAVLETAQGNFIVAGYGTESADIYLLGINEHGDSCWTRTYGHSGLDYGFSMQRTRDGAFIVSGHTNSFGDGSYDICLLKIDANGDTLWTRVYAAETRDEGYSATECLDGGYIIAGSTKQQTLWSDFCVIRTDDMGNIIWRNTYGRDYTDAARSVVQTEDKGFLVVGYSESSMFGDEDFFLIRLDELGKLMWQKAYGGVYDDWANEVQPTSDGGYVLVGTTTTFGTTWEDACLVKVDAKGTFKWKRSFGGSGAEKGFSVRETPDGGFIAAGYTTSYGEGDKDVYIVKTDAQGNELWSKTFGGSTSDVGFSIRETSDGGYIVAGYTDSFSDSRDVYVIKFFP
jgi:hypothetical protein